MRELERERGRGRDRVREREREGERGREGERVRERETWSSCDLLVPGSPQSSMLTSALNFPLPVFWKSFLVPPNSCSKMPFLMSSFS